MIRPIRIGETVFENLVKIFFTVGKFIPTSTTTTVIARIAAAYIDMVKYFLFLSILNIASPFGYIENCAYRLQKYGHFSNYNTLLKRIQYNFINNNKKKEKIS